MKSNRSTKVCCCMNFEFIVTSECTIHLWYYDIEFTETFTMCIIGFRWLLWFAFIYNGIHSYILSFELCQYLQYARLSLKFRIHWSEKNSFVAIQEVFWYQHIKIQKTNINIIIKSCSHSILPKTLTNTCIK